MADLSALKFIVELDEACDERAHVYRSGKEHDTDTVRCWCNPTLYFVCDCEGGCWKCGDQNAEARRLTVEEAEAPDAPFVLVAHHT